MPRYDRCQSCGQQVQRTPTSAEKITCRTCRAIKRCGTTAGYSAGCKCQACKDAKAASMREYVARRKAEGRPLPKRKWRAYEELTCDCCEATFNREKRNKRKYKGTYCTELCRDFHRWGPLSRKLPRDHWARLIGKTCSWKPPVTLAPTAFTCAWCEKPGISNHPTTEYCDDVCRGRAKRARRRGKVFGAHGTYTWGQVVRLWASFDRACAYCHRPTELQDIQAEHVIALARGGANNISNILPSCAPCNSDKRDLALHEWEADRARRHLPPVTTHWDASDTRYRHLSWGAVDLAA